MLNRSKKTCFICRVLAFSLSKITSVKVKINNEDWKYCHHVDGPLYVAPWNPHLYPEGLHNIEVILLMISNFSCFHFVLIQVLVKDLDGRSKIIKHSFALDGTRLSFNVMPKFFLSISANVMVSRFFVDFSFKKIQYLFFSFD